VPIVACVVHERPDAEEGFTVLELLVVVIVIGLLAAIAIPGYLNQRQRAHDLTLRADMHNLSLEMSAHWSETLVYPVPRQLAQAGVPFSTSPKVRLTVVWAAGDDFCMVGTSSASGPDQSGIGAYVGVTTRMFARTASTRPQEVTASRPGCLASRPVSATNGYFASDGYHDAF
jgi:type IV pilus assembly protein PilA